MTTPMDSAPAAPMGVLNSILEMSFYIFKPLSRQIYTMNLWTSLSGLVSYNREKLYTTNIHVSVLRKYLNNLAVILK